MRLRSQLASLALTVGSFVAFNHFYGDAAGESQAASSATHLTPMPPFTLPLIGSKPAASVTLHSLLGRKTFIEFWASWCESCRQERPLLAKLRTSVPAGSMLAIAVQDDEASVAKSEGSNPHGYRVVLDERGDLTQKLGIDAIPQSLILDEQGRIVRHFKGPLRETDLKEISQLLH